MSNPGVITLASARNLGPNVLRLDVEDNIGEAIHIHWNGLRLDLSVAAFLRFADELKYCEASLVDAGGFSRARFDPYFLFRMGRLVGRVDRVEVRGERLGDLICLVGVRLRGLGQFMLPKPITRAPAYRYLRGESEAFLSYEHDSYPGLENRARIEDLLDSIRRSGYPAGDRYIVLFGNQKYIRDGQHRAACLAAEGGLDQKIDVLVVHFVDDSWRLHPYRTFLLDLAKAIARRFRDSMRSVARALVCRIRGSVS